MRILIASLATLALVGCGGGASTPDGYETYDTPRVSFAHPPGWTVRDGGGNWVATAPGNAGGNLNLSVNEVPDERAREQVIDQLDQVKAPLAQRGPVEDFDVQLDGAQETKGFRVDGEKETTIAYWAVLDDDKTVVRLVVSGPEDKLDVEGVANSLQVKDG